jgi:hypothetical protein
MGQYPTSSKPLVWKSQGPPPRQKSHLDKHTPRYSFQAPFTISSNAFRTQEWSNLARDDVWRLRKTPPLVSFLVGSAAYSSPWWWRQQDLWNVGKLLPDYTALQPRRQPSSKRQLVAHGDYYSIASCRTNIPAIFRIFRGISKLLFIPRFLAEPLTTFCGTLVGKHYKHSIQLPLFFIKI